MWNLPRPGMGPVSPALEGGFATIGPPEESSVQVFSDEIDGDNNKSGFFFDVVR